MDLLDLVLARLPLDAFLRTGRDPKIRIRDVNRISPKRSQKFRRAVRNWPSETPVYALECALQGELSVSATELIPTTLLLSRAAFVGDARMYEYLITTRNYLEIDLDIAISSGVPEIQAWAMAHADRVIEVRDLEIIVRSPWLLDYLKVEPDLILSPRYAGFFHRPLGKHDRLSYLTGFIEREMIGRDDPFRPIETVDRLIDDMGYGNVGFKETLADNYIYAGYFSPLVGYFDTHAEFLLERALINIQPKLLFQIPEHIGVDISRVITPSMVVRAREMLPLIEMRSPTSIRYIAQLRIICGLPVDLSEFDSDDSVRQYAITVAHPQMDFYLRDAGAHYSYDVYYDLDRYFDRRNDHNFGSDYFKIHLQYARGGFFNTPVDREVLWKVEVTPERSSEKYVAELRDRFNRIMKFFRPK